MCNGSVELGRENAIAVMDKKAAAMVGWDGFAELLQCPRCCGVGCYIAVHNPSRLVFDNDQDVEHTETGALRPCFRRRGGTHDADHRRAGKR